MILLVVIVMFGLFIMVLLLFFLLIFCFYCWVFDGFVVSIFFSSRATSSSRRCLLCSCILLFLCWYLCVSLLSLLRFSCVLCVCVLLFFCVRFCFSNVRSRFSY